MSTIVLDAHHEPRAKDDQKLKRSFFASVAIHVGVVLVLLILSVIPHKFHFDQSALIELQGIPELSGNSGPLKTAVNAHAQPKAPKVAALKSNVKNTTAQSATKSQNASEKISVKHTKTIRGIRDTIPIAKSQLGHVPVFPKSPAAKAFSWTPPPAPSRLDPGRNALSRTGTTSHKRVYTT